MIETVRAKKVDEVTIEVKFTAICPLTKTVDEYELVLRYTPAGDKYVEFVSFKRYLESFKEREILHEELAATIADDVCRAVGPADVQVELRSVFMGMKITVVKKKTC